MFPTGLPQVGGGEGEKDAQQGDVLPIGSLSLTGSSRFRLK